jgi:hypothetical protein
MTQTIARIPLDAQLACVRREISYRSRVYPRLVEAHKMTQRARPATATRTTIRPTGSTAVR